jgi:endonuclease YncB( thermonuclease family)
MNERIKELAEQADNYAYKMNPEEDSYGRSANPRKFQQDRDAKFAELLIKECYALVDYENKQFIKAQFKEHFGVEE